MITIEQCRAARGLLGWTQQDLANASGLSKTAINNFEKRHSDIKAESLRAIRLAFETAGIEFQSDNGLRQRKKQVEVLHGSEGFTRLGDDIIQTLTEQDGELIMLCARPLTPETQTLRKRLESENITLRALQTDGITTFIYGSKLALQMRDGAMIVIIDSPSASDAERERLTAANAPKSRSA